MERLARVAVHRVEVLAARRMRFGEGMMVVSVDVRMELGHPAQGDEQDKQRCESAQTETRRHTHTLCYGTEHPRACQPTHPFCIYSPHGAPLRR